MLLYAWANLLSEYLNSSCETCLQMLFLFLPTCKQTKWSTSSLRPLITSLKWHIMFPAAVCWFSLWWSCSTALISHHVSKDLHVRKTGASNMHGFWYTFCLWQTVSKPLSTQIEKPLMNEWCTVKLLTCSLSWRWRVVLSSGSSSWCLCCFKSVSSGLDSISVSTSELWLWLESCSSSLFYRNDASDVENKEEWMEENS